MSIRNSKKIYIIKRISDFKSLLDSFSGNNTHPSAIESELNSLSWEYDSLIYLIDSYNDSRFIKDNSVVRMCMVSSMSEKLFVEELSLSLRDSWNSFVSGYKNIDGCEKYYR